MLKTKGISLSKSNVPFPSDWAFEYLLHLPQPLRGLDEKIRSPFSRDTNASFSIYKTESGNYRFKCFSTSLQGDATDLLIALEKKNGIDIDRGKAYKRLIEAFKSSGAQSSYQPSDTPGVVLNTKAKVTGFDMRQFNKTDLEYWKQFGIGMEILEEYNVAALKKFTMSKVVEGEPKEYIFEHPQQYGYFRRTGDLHKIYQPGRKPKAIKVGSGYLEGNDQLLKPQENLLITKSLKDVMGWRGLEIEGWDSVSCDSENVLIPKKTIEEKKDIYKRILVLMDNDEAGNRSATEYQKKYEIPSIQLNLSKDLTDSIRDYSQTAVKLKLMQIL